MSNIQSNINQMISSAAIATNLAKSVEEQKAQTKLANEQKELQVAQNRVAGANIQDQMIKSGVAEVQSQNKEKIDKYNKLSNRVAKYGARFTGEKDMNPRQQRYFNSLYKQMNAVGIQDVEDLIQSRVASIKMSKSYQAAGELAASGDATRYQKYLADAKLKELNTERYLDKYKDYTSNNGLEEVLTDLTNKQKEKEGF